jgi:hypothetical protein
MVSPTTLLGAAGEHHVMSQMLRRGMIAALAPAGVPNADILVTDSIGDRLCAVQVKTRRGIGSDGGWHMKAKHEEIASSSLFYCFVDFGDGMTLAPASWLVPSPVVAEILQKSYRAWLTKPGKKGQEHKDTLMRRFLPDYSHWGLGEKYGKGWLDDYHERWDLIGSHLNC